MAAYRRICSYPLPALPYQKSLTTKFSSKSLQYQSFKPYVKEGGKVFINGGSGGTGVFCIQIAKLLDCYITSACSSAKIDLCKSLGADKIIDCKLVEIGEALQGKGQVFDLAVDTVGSPVNLYKHSQSFLDPDGQFIQGGTPSGFIGHALSILFLGSLVAERESTLWK